MRRLFFLAGLMSALMLSSHAFAGVPKAKEVSIAMHGHATSTVVIQTHAVEVKETESKTELAKFGEVYAFSPSFFAVYRDQPTRIELWNLQDDDRHNFTLIDPQGKVLMSMTLSPLAKKSLIFTFHRDGLYRFICNIHQPEMSGEILVLPPQHGSE